MKTHKDGRLFDDPNEVRSSFYAVQIEDVKDRKILVDVRDVDWLETHLGWTREKAIYWTASNGKQECFRP